MNLVWNNRFDIMDYTLVVRKDGSVALMLLRRSMTDRLANKIVLNFKIIIIPDEIFDFSLCLTKPHVIIAMLIHSSWFFSGKAYSGMSFDAHKFQM